MMAYHSLCNYFVIFFILTIWIDTVVICMDEVPDRGFRQLDDEVTTTSPKKWDTDVSIEKLIRITNLRVTDPKILAKEVMRIILGENMLQYLTIQHERNSDAVYSLIPEKVKKFVFEYVNERSHLQIDESTFKDAVNQLFNEINEVMSIDSSSSEEGNNVQSLTDNMDVIDDEENTEEGNYVHTLDIKDVIYDDSPLRSYLQDFMDSIDEDLTDIVKEGENGEEDILTDISSSLTQKNPTTPSGRNKPSYPYQDDGNNKVELLEGSKIWLTEKEFESYKKDLKHNPNQVIESLLESLLGKNNLKYFSLYGLDGYKPIPMNVREAIFEFVKKNLKKSHEETNAILSETIIRFLGELHSKSNEDIIDEITDDVPSGSNMQGENTEEDIMDEINDDVPSGSNMQGENRAEDIMNESTDDVPSISNIQDIMNESTDDGPSASKKRREDRAENISAPLKKKRPTRRKGIYEKKKFFKKPNSYPYEEEREGKVELLNESKIWIDKDELFYLKKYYKKVPNQIIRQLLGQLLGEENLPFMTFDRDKNRTIPAEVKSSIYDFMNKTVNAGYEMDYDAYKNSTLKILKNIKFSFNKGENKTDIQKLKTSKYPYRTKGENKVELFNESKIFIDKNKLEWIKNNFKDDAKTMIKVLLENLLGKKNIPFFGWIEISGYKAIPQEVKESIFQFINKNVIPEEIKTYETYKSTVIYLLKKKGKKFQQENLKTDGQKNKKIKYPYKENIENKVELLNNSNIWITEKERESYVKDIKKNPKKSLRKLLVSLIGENNLKYFSLKGKHGYKTLPYNVNRAILEFVNQNVKRNLKVTNETFSRIINRLLPRIHSKSNKAVTLRLSIQEQVKQTNNKLDLMDSSLQDIKRDNNTLKAELSTCKRKCNSLLEENKFLTERVKECERKVDFISYKERSKNVILYKVPDTENENKNLLNTVKEIIHRVNTNLPTDTITDVKRLGKQEGSRPILISFNNSNCKSFLFQNRKALSNMNIAIANDLSKEEREKRKNNYLILLKYKEILQQKGKTAIIKGPKIIVDEEMLNVEDVEKQLKKMEHSEVERESEYYSDSEESTTSKASTASGTKRGRSHGSKNKIKKKIKTSSDKMTANPLKAFLIPQNRNAASNEEAKKLPVNKS
ncbi:MATH and LRR domain-containing protein PFE0570w-like isoform X3 [Leptopilina heterotoma]|uniref:MATH and LRR domain-containing protein PFE0570w-like isoform X3 n=1 Tax=Leptopilina heterotoma TaxID=63436 RepID=UPI001CA881A9|nr:MATH and LRR domain-containing protein PFE0570w-like isoform X3 [Leptopilina heterotoma]